MKILIIASSLLMNLNFLADTFWGNIFFYKVHVPVICGYYHWIMSNVVEI